MIDELKQLRKEYAVNKETSSSFDHSVISRNLKQRNSSISLFTSEKKFVPSLSINASQHDLLEMPQRNKSDLKITNRQPILEPIQQKFKKTKKSPKLAS